MFVRRLHREEQRLATRLLERRDEFFVHRVCANAADEREVDLLSITGEKIKRPPLVDPERIVEKIDRLEPPSLAHGLNLLDEILRRAKPHERALAAIQLLDRAVIAERATEGAAAAGHEGLRLAGTEEPAIVVDAAVGKRQRVELRQAAKRVAPRSLPASSPTDFRSPWDLRGHRDNRPARRRRARLRRCKWRRPASFRGCPEKNVGCGPP